MEIWTSAAVRFFIIIIIITASFRHFQTLSERKAGASAGSQKREKVAWLNASSLPLTAQKRKFKTKLWPGWWQWAIDLSSCGSVTATAKGRRWSLLLSVCQLPATKGKQMCKILLSCVVTIINHWLLILAEHLYRIQYSPLWDCRTTGWKRDQRRIMDIYFLFLLRED